MWQNDALHHAARKTSPISLGYSQALTDRPSNNKSDPTAGRSPASVADEVLNDHMFHDAAPAVIIWGGGETVASANSNPVPFVAFSKPLHDPHLFMDGSSFLLRFLVNVTTILFHNIP